jgi:flagellum-specific peptidoglycan hydrolase FlgJ
MAAADMKKSGILASLTIAQAILESGWGSPA